MSNIGLWKGKASFAMK